MNCRVVSAVGCLLLTCIVGCGGEGSTRVPVIGTVTFDGTKVDKGVIAFLPMEGTLSPSSGAGIADGKYDISKEAGPNPGKYRVEITATRSAGKVEVKGIGGATGGLSGGGTVDKIEMFIPDVYNTKSTLTVDIKPGANTHNFELKSAP